jgi:hypothetical protein
MRIKIYILMSLILLGLTSATLVPKKEAVLILADTIDSECFSKFKIVEVDDVLVGINIDEDFPVVDGIYRIVGTSNSKYQNRNIVIK